MAKVTIEVLDAVVDGKHKGETLEISERSLKMLQDNGYAKLVEEKKPTKKSDSEKGTSSPKKKSGKKSDKKKDEPKKEEKSEGSKR